MESSAIESTIAPASGDGAWKPVSLVRFLPLVWLATLWTLAFYQVHTTWIVNAVYSYGWGVPVLAGYLAWLRWETRPTVPRRGSAKIVAVTSVVMLLAYVPVRIIHEANPDWVKANWALIGIACGLTLTAAFAAGGWRYARHFAFPVLFCFTAVPWPIWFETALVQGLMKSNANLCADVLTLIGLPAMAQGNLIQVATTTLNVEEACSGIRSLQTAFMMALFLGEFHRLGMIRRIALVGLSLALAIVSNMIRTLVLAYIAAASLGDWWHDTVGNIVMVLTLVAVWWAASLVRPRAAATNENMSGAKASSAHAISSPYPLWSAMLGIVAVVAAEVVTRAWYRSHERDVAPAVVWTMKAPVSAREFVERPFHERSKALLKFNSGWTGSWIDPTGYRWQAYFLEWSPGRVSKYLAMSHYPTVCLPATGLVLVGESGTWEWKEDGVRLPFTSYVFSDNGRDVHVFHAIIENRPLSSDSRFTYYQVTSEERYASVLRGERNLGQKVVGLAIRGCSSPVEAQQVVSEALRSLVVRPRQE